MGKKQKKNLKVVCSFDRFPRQGGGSRGNGWNDVGGGTQWVWEEEGGYDRADRVLTPCEGGGVDTVLLRQFV